MYSNLFRKSLEKVKIMPYIFTYNYVSGVAYFRYEIQCISFKNALWLFLLHILKETQILDFSFQMSESGIWYMPWDMLGSLNVEQGFRSLFFGVT